MHHGHTVEKYKLHDAYLEKNHQIVVWDEYNTELTLPQDKTGMHVSWIENAKLLAVDSSKCSLLARCNRRRFEDIKCNQKP